MLLFKLLLLLCPIRSLAGYSVTSKFTCKDKFEDNLLLVGFSLADKERNLVLKR